MYLKCEPLVPLLRTAARALDGCEPEPGLGARSGLVVLAVRLTRSSGKPFKTEWRLLRRIMTGEVTVLQEDNAERIALLLGHAPEMIWPARDMPEIDWSETT